MTEFPEKTRKTVEELAESILKTHPIPESLLQKCLRLVRFDSTQSLAQHSKAIKTLIKEKILYHEDSASSSSTIISFEKEYDELRRLNPGLLISVLALMEPLAYSHIDNDQSQAINPKIITANDKIKPEDSNMKSMVNNPLPSNLQMPFLPNPSAAEHLYDTGIFWISRDLELKIITDLLFIFQGINGKHIKYDSRSESYAIDPQLKAMIPPPVRDLILCLCEVGWLFEKISKYTTKVESNEAIGLISQAFAFALQEELHDYYRLLAVLEQEIHRLTTNQSEAQGTSGLTLLRLRAWMQEPIERMCLMTRLVDGANILSGGALASRLHGHGKHGDVFISSFVQRIMDHVCMPLYNMLSRWILYGDLQDPYEEFFVGIHRNTASMTFNVWLDTYYLRNAMLPSFIPLSLAIRILVIGKTINFIRLCMASLPKKTAEKVSILPNTEYKPRNRSPRHSALLPPMNNNSDDSEIDLMTDGDLSTWLINSLGQDIETSLRRLRYGGELELVEVVQKIGYLTDNRLMRLLEKRYHLSDHLLACKKYLLLGQGDFVTCLMDSIGPELRKRANQLYRHNLTGMVESAIRASNAQYDPNYILDRIGVRLLEASPGDTGWEIFSLDYKIDMPINAVVHNDAISKYRIAFHMFWRLKRVEWSLSASWKQMMTFTHTRGEVYLPQLRPVIHRCTLNRGRMMHVVNNLCAFIMFEVLETAWVKLQENLIRAKCLDDIIRFHDRYLEEILDRALLSQPHEQLNLQIQQLLQSILRFCALEESLIADAMAALARKRGAQGIGNDTTVRSSAFSERSFDLDTVDGVPAYVINRLEDAAVDFNARFDEIMITLKEQVTTKIRLVILIVIDDAYCDCRASKRRIFCAI
jgi:gamma-tubulin complex component 3